MNNITKYKNLKEDDIKNVLEIYNYHINNGFGNFEEKPLTYKSFNRICKNILHNKLPFIVCWKNKKLIGFTYLSNFRNKSGYKFSYENSVYVHHEHMGTGVGNELLTKLIESSSKNTNIKTIIAVIEANSKPSIKIHKKNGFNMIGTLKKIGFKKDHWLNVIYMQKILR